MRPNSSNNAIERPLENNSVKKVFINKYVCIPLGSTNLNIKKKKKKYRARKKERT